MQSGSCRNNICELKRQIDSQAVEIGHTRTGYGQSRREQALLHEELADRERALRDTRIRSIQKLEELKRDQEFRLEELSRRRMVENHFKRCRICAQWTIISRSMSTCVIFSSSWTRRIAKPPLKFAAKYMGYAWYIRKRFLDGVHASTSTTYSGMLNSMQASTGKPVTESGDRDHNQSWAKMAKIPNSFSNFSSNFWFPKRPSTGILTLFQKECTWRVKGSRSLRFQGNAKRKIIEGKVREEGRSWQSIWKQSQLQCWPEW